MKQIDISRTLDTLLIDAVSIPPLKEDFKVVFSNVGIKNRVFIHNVTNVIVSSLKKRIYLVFG
jgi:hypothetical protein